MPTVSNIDQNISITCSKNETIFEAFDNQGHHLPHGCLSGNCCVCIVEITQGAENLSEIDPIEEMSLNRYFEKFPEKKEMTLRLGCRANILGDIQFQA